MKSNESLFKLPQDTEKAKIFADQIEEQAKRKLELIKKRQELEEAETLNAVAEAKDKLKVAQMLETLVEDTVSKHNLSVKSESVPNHHLKTILKPNCPEFEPYLEHKTAISEPQITNSISQNLRPSTSYFIPKISNDQVQMDNVRENTYSTPHTQYPDMKFIHSGTPYPKNNDSYVSIHPNNCIDDFIDRLVEGKETVLPERDPVLSASMLLQLEYESKCLPVMELFRFDGDPCKCPDFIQNFKNRVHDKRSFTDDIRMERLLSVLDGEAKRTVTSIGRSGLFYATAMKTLKSNFGNPMVVSFLKLKSVLDLPQITNENRAGLRAFHQQLKSVITWLNSMGDTSAINSIENTTKAITRLPRFLRSKFLETSKMRN